MYKDFLRSLKWLKNWKDLLLIIFFDISFYLISVLIVLAFSLFINNKSRLMPLIDSSIFSNLAQFQIIYALYRNFYYTFLAGLIIVFLILIVNLAIFKGLIWSKTQNRRFTVAHVKKFIYLSFSWAGSWIILFIINLVIVRREILAKTTLFLLFVMLYFYPIVYVIFTKENKLIHAIKTGFIKGIRHGHRFLLAYLLGFLFYYIVYYKLIYRAIFISWDMVH